MIDIIVQTESVAPMPKRSLSCHSGLVLDQGNVKVVDRRLFSIAVNWSDEVFNIKSLESLIN